ncbi:hypothetical protein G7Y89_g12133 [Cudoniella acicularis]|uniref:Uncharacterized protein n=1 Tax=Cudoniella acicularis TaxID=354080 RepID=A0A8H4RD65_9HELO|nr:hypothetical protein G7Y89_g12133 [Cudoniella acicularis]
MTVRAIKIGKDGRVVRMTSRAGDFEFQYSYCKGFRVLNYKFEPHVCYRAQRPIKYWKAQLAFRGLDHSGSDIECLKQRLGTADTRFMDLKVVRVRNELEREWKRVQNLRRYIMPNHEMWDLAVQKPKALLKYIFFDENGNDWGAEPVALIDAGEDARRELFIAAGDLYMRKTVSNDLVIGSGKNKLGKEMYKKLNKMAENEKRAKGEKEMDPCRKSTTTTTTAATATQPEMVEDEDCVIVGSRTLREEIPDSEDEGDKIIYYEDGPRKSIEKATKNGHSSLPNHNARIQRLSPVLEIQMRDVDDDSCSDVGCSIYSDEWDITGVWKLESSQLAHMFEPSPLSMEIFTKFHRGGRETFGRFNFGKFDGIFRFTKTRRPEGHHKRVPYTEDKDEFLLKVTDNPSTKNPTRCFRWRGQESKPRVLEQDADGNLYTMTFSEGGKKMSGTWGTLHPIPGNVSFSGVKVAEGDPFETCNIGREWKRRKATV